MFSRSKGGGKWSSYGCDGKKSSGNSIDINGGVSKGGSLIVTHSDYSSNGYQGGNGTGGNQTQNSVVTSNYYGYGNSQGLGKLYEPEEVLGMSGHTKKNPYGDSETIDQIIEYCKRMSDSCWGSNAILCGGGKGYMKAINLSRIDMHDNDCGNLFYTLRNYNFNLEILNLSNNRIGDLGLESMIYGITSLQFQTLYSADNGWKPYQSSLKTVQSVITINLSNNQIGDKGAYILADHLAKGNFLNLNSLNVSDNQITGTGYGYLAKGLEAVTQDLKIVFETVKGFSKDALKASMKGMLFIAKNNGISTKETLTTDETIEHCKKGTVNVGLNIVGGYYKCTNPVVKIAHINEMNLGSITAEILGYYVKPIGAILTFACITEKTVFSVVDENFANCLVGVDSLLEE